MIQRLQTVFLVLAILLNLTVYFTPIYEKAIADPQWWVGTGLATVLLFAMIINGVSIFMYNNRPLQMTLVKRSMIFQIIALGFSVGILFSLGGIGTYLWDEALGTGLVFLGLIFQILALRYIRKDEDLVRSMDRIR